MLENIKSIYICKKILECISNRTILNLFRYNKFYQTKFNIKKFDYIFEIFNTIDLDLQNDIYRLKETYNCNLENLFNNLKKKFPFFISNDILKECLINYAAKMDNNILSINHIYFNEIVEKRLLLKKNNFNIEFDLEENLSQNDLINIITHQNSKDKVSNYLKEKLNLNNSLIKKLEVILNSDINLNSIYFEIRDQSILSIDVEKDKLEFNGKESFEEKNILIDFKLKRADLINKILEKNCKNIKEMKYIVFEEKTTKNIKKIFPLIELDKFENLNKLDLDILYNGENANYIIYNFTNKLSKLKELKINEYSRRYRNDILNLYLQKETLNRLKSLEIKYMNWIVNQNESFDFKGLERIHLDNVFLPQKEIEGKKYFFKEMLKGNLKWESLKTIEIYLTFDMIPEQIDEFKNKEIINLLKVARERESYEPEDSDFFPNFFKFIFSNQNIYIKANENNKNIENFKLYIYDSNPCMTCQIKEIVYEKKEKNVNIYLGEKIYGESLYTNFLYESPLIYVNFNNFVLDPCLDSFTFDHHTIETVNKIKQFLSDELKKIEYYKKGYKIYDKKDFDFDKEINELTLKMDSLKNKRKYENKGDENSYEKIMFEIEDRSVSTQLDEIERLIKKLKIKKNEKRSKKKEVFNKKCNYDIDMSLNDFFGD